VRAQATRIPKKTPTGFAAQTTSFDGFVLAVSPDIPAIFHDTDFMGREDIAAASAEELVRYVARRQAADG
jgi:hypothetical protein